jgi:hypothetical protein
MKQEFLKLTSENVVDYIGSAIQVIAIEKPEIFRHPWTRLYLVVKKNNSVHLVDANGYQAFCGYGRLSDLIKRHENEYDFYILKT